MRVSPSSQAGRILALLEQGGWWSCSELLREVPSVVHTRMDNVRKHLRDEGLGRTIEHKTTGVGAEHSLYRLVALSAAGDREVGPNAADEGTPFASPGLASPVAENATSPRVLAAPQRSSSPDSEGAPPQSVPSEVQMALELPARLREVA